MHPDWGPGVAWATAIVTAALVGAQNFRSVTGKGGLGQVDGRQVALGSQALFLELGIELGELMQRAEGLRRDGQTVLFVAVDNRPASLMGVADPIKASTPEALRILHEDGVQIVMLTGDSRTTAEAVARTRGIDRVEAEVLPAQKAEMVKPLQTEGHVVAMAGDGVNDAPALAQAHEGVSHLVIRLRHAPFVRGTRPTSRWSRGPRDGVVATRHDGCGGAYRSMPVAPAGTS